MNTNVIVAITVMVHTRTGKPGQRGRGKSEKHQRILLRVEKLGNFTQNTEKNKKDYTGKMRKNTGSHLFCGPSDQTNDIFPLKTDHLVRRTTEQV